MIVITTYAESYKMLESLSSCKSHSVVTKNRAPLNTIKGSTGRERAMRVSAALFVVEDEERVGRHYEEGGVSTEEKYAMGVSQDASFCCLPLQSSSAFLLPTGESKAGKANSTRPNSIM
ncbi:hypothetical protein SAY87_018752 [Trapa incisa]|uniref:Uncharacterized protein n=1 Tax=Trapa incisa TaxID=236973 RepID=A0AAN7K0E7_9MYRT|nr:hypothetical protein SAY87_018752 [Trapa incisa]